MSFPDDRLDTLTFIYLNNQDLSNLTPEELVDKYDEIYKQINEYRASKTKIS